MFIIFSYPSLDESTSFVSLDGDAATRAGSPAAGSSNSIVGNNGGATDTSRNSGDAAGSHGNKHWPPYDLAQQKFMQVSVSTQPPIVRDHYRAHRLALWTHLIPQLHR